MVMRVEGFVVSLAVGFEVALAVGAEMAADWQLMAINAMSSREMKVGFMSYRDCTEME
jgi:hypothetical protein